MSKQRLNNLFFFLGIAAVIVMLFTFDVSFVELWEHICHAGYWLIPIVGVWIIIYGINALSWREIIRSKTASSPTPSTTPPPSVVSEGSPIASLSSRRTSAASMPPPASSSMR